MIIVKEDNIMKCSKCFDKLVKQNNNNVMKTLKKIFKKTIDKS